MSDHDVAYWEKILGHLAGVAGALVSMRFVQGTFVERMIMMFGGASFSYYASEIISQKLSIPEGLTGFLLGLFGMSILSRLWDWLQTTSVIDWLLRIITGGKVTQAPKRRDNDDQ